MRKMSNLEILQSIQERKNYIPLKYLERICRKNKIPKSKIYGVLTFYSQFTTRPQGKYLIRLCEGTACHVKGSDKIREILEREFGLEDGKTTSDMRFTFQVVACLGSCFIAPCMMINNDYYGNLDEEKVKKIIKSLK
ncbi:MAG: NAD(P)H-dependent oxidoreductase subunit E [Candidatus Ratteibacteria bacterium]